MKKSWLLCLSILIFFLSGATSAHGEVLSNSNWTISIGNEHSWTGRNNTGNLSYYGCNRNCNCVYLTGGKITCRTGVCQTIWRHKNKVYVLSSAITNASDRGQIPSTLIISADSKVILEAELYPKAFDNINYLKKL